MNHGKRKSPKGSGWGPPVWKWGFHSCLFVQSHIKGWTGVQCDIVCGVCGNLTKVLIVLPFVSFLILKGRSKHRKFRSVCLLCFAGFENGSVVCFGFTSLSSATLQRKSKMERHSLMFPLCTSDWKRGNSWMKLFTVKCREGNWSKLYSSKSFLNISEQCWTILENYNLSTQKLWMM